jgi:hypothetical protein
VGGPKDIQKLTLHINKDILGHLPYNKKLPVTIKKQETILNVSVEKDDDRVEASNTVTDSIPVLVRLQFESLYKPFLKLSDFALSYNDEASSTTSSLQDEVTPLFTMRLQYCGINSSTASFQYQTEKATLEKFLIQPIHTQHITRVGHCLLPLMATDSHVVILPGISKVSKLPAGVALRIMQK